MQSSSLTGRPRRGRRSSLCALLSLFYAALCRLTRAVRLQSGNDYNPGIIPQAVSDIFTFIRDVRIAISHWQP